MKYIQIIENTVKVNCPGLIDKATINQSSLGWYCNFYQKSNKCLFRLLSLDSHAFCDSILGPHNWHDGDWPYMPDRASVVKVLQALDDKLQQKYADCPIHLNHTLIDGTSVTITIGDDIYRGKVDSTSKGYYLSLPYSDNGILFEKAKVSKVPFSTDVLGYQPNGEGQWPYMKTPEDVIKVLKALDEKYPQALSADSNPDDTGLGEPENTETFNTDTLDFTVTKPHYQLNFDI